MLVAESGKGDEREPRVRLGWWPRHPPTPWPLQEEDGEDTTETTMFNCFPGKHEVGV